MRKYRKIGVYAIEVPSLMKVYVGTSLDVGNCLAQHRSRLKLGKVPKAMKADFDSGARFVFKLVEEGADMAVLKAKALNRYANEGWRLYNDVLGIPEGNGLDIPERFIPLVKKFVAALKSGRLDHDSVDENLSNLAG